MLKRAKAGVKGLIATWVDPDPFNSGGANFSQMAVSHRNPVWKIAAEDVLRNHGDWIISGAQFKWLINIQRYHQQDNTKSNIKTYRKVYNPIRHF